MIISQFPEAFIQLNIEVTQHHPLLQYKLQPDQDFDEKLATIAAHCQVVVDGYFTLEDKIKVADLLRNKLVKMRTIQVFSEIPNESVN